MNTETMDVSVPLSLTPIAVTMQDAAGNIGSMNLKDALTEMQKSLPVVNNATFVTTQGGRMPLDEIKNAAVEEAVTTTLGLVGAAQGGQPATYTLEQTTSPLFEVTNRAAADAYIANMGGYAFKKSGGVWYAAKLHPADWNKGFADGTPMDNWAKYETMIHVPKCHFKASGKTMQFGGIIPIEGGHSFASPEWVGAYLMSSGGHSRPDVAPSYSNTMTGFWNTAQTLGSEWGLANYQFHCLVNALFQAKFGNLNSQEAVGAGWQNGDWTACRNVVMGLTRCLGDGTGKVLYNNATVGNQNPTKLFGFEDLWGKLWEFRPGIRFYMDGSTRKALVYDGNRVSNTATDGRIIDNIKQSAGGGNALAMRLGEWWDMLCDTTGSDSAHGYCDGYWAATGGELLYVGGGAYGSLRCGLSSADSNDEFSDSGTDIGARSAFFGRPKLVSGSELTAMA